MIISAEGDAAHYQRQASVVDFAAVPGPAPAAIDFGTGEPCPTGAGEWRGSATEGLKEGPCTFTA